MSTGEQRAAPRKPPLPLVQAYLVCRAVYEDRHTGGFVLVEPFNGISLTFFLAGFRVSLYVHLVGGHGVYQLALELRNEEGERVWGGGWAELIRYTEPLLPYRVTLNNAVLEFPAPGRYDLVLTANGDDLAHHALDVTPAR